MRQTRKRVASSAGRNYAGCNPIQEIQLLRGRGFKDKEKSGTNIIKTKDPKAENCTSDSTSTWSPLGNVSGLGPIFNRSQEGTAKRVTVYKRWVYPPGNNIQPGGVFPSRCPSLEGHLDGSIGLTVALWLPDLRVWASNPGNRSVKKQRDH